MTDLTDIEKIPLVWPKLFDNLEQHKENIEHIEFKTNMNSIAEILFEIEFRHPHISNKLKLLLGHPEFEIEIKNLVVSERENRAGFDKLILNCLMKLYELHRDKYQHTILSNIDIWEMNRLR